MSVLQSCVPRQWKTAIIHPVPKVQNLSTPAEYRPISVVSILSRIVERIIVHSYIYPAFLKPPVVENNKDQSAFRPTGSTTAAVIDLLQQTNTMLLTNDFVVIISLDFTKAFDAVRHQTLRQKMCSFDLPDHIYNWVVNYFNNRHHITSHQGALSRLVVINASVIQGSVMGPPSYNVF